MTMTVAISSRVESDYLLIVSSGKIDTIEEYRILLRRYCDEILASGFKKILINESSVNYAKSFFLQSDIVEFYSSGELPEEFSTWKIACVGPEDMSMYYDFWEMVAQNSGYDQHGFSSIESAREFLNK